MKDKVNQQFQCRVTEKEFLLTSKVLDSYGFETQREFITSFSEMLDSGELTTKLKEYRIRKTNNRMTVTKNINTKH